MAPPRVGNSTKAVVPSRVPVKAPASKPVETAKPVADTGFDSARRKRGANTTGRYKPVARAPLPVKKELSNDVAKLRAAVQAGGAATPKLDPEVKGALDRIKLVASRGKEAIGDVMKDLDPSVAVEVLENLPTSVKAEIAQNTPFGFEPPSVRMAQVQTMSDAQLKAIGDSMRAGQIEDPALQLAVGTELAARTKWGKDNPEIVAYQRKLVVDGKVNFKDGRGAGRTETSGEVKMDLSLSKSPEALAALLAHEATHSFHATHGGLNSVYQEETSGNLASARVWSEIGKKDDSNLTVDQRDGLNEYAEQYQRFGEDGVQARVATEYAREASKTYEKHPKPSEKAKVTDLMDSLANDPGAVKAMRPEYVQELATALLRSGANEEDVKKLGRTLKNLQPALKAVLPYMLGDLDKDARQTLLDAMK